MKIFTNGFFSFRILRPSRHLNDALRASLFSAVSFHLYFVFAATALGLHQVQAQMELQESAGHQFQYGARLETSFPVFLGPSIYIKPFDQLELSAGFGFTPELYYSVIGDFAASSGGNAAYSDLIKAAFQNNSIVKFSGAYRFSDSAWQLSFGTYYLSSKGNADIDTVLAATTGRDFTTLKNALAALGKSTQVEMTSALAILELGLDHNWQLQENSSFLLGVGLAKVADARVDIKTGLALFDSTAAGQNFITQSEGDLQKIILENGLSPTLRAQFNYEF